MNEHVLLGRDRQILASPQTQWQQHLAQVPQHSESRLRFMTDAHHRVRYFVVRELVNRAKPLEPTFISEALGLPLQHVQVILEELERKLFFLVRDEQGAVAWAYPVTVEPTPHRLTFNTGERLYGA
jgi:hypothetical protein